jgi:cell division protein FtsI (penicillin-binding protein 3)
MLMALSVCLWCVVITIRLVQLQVLERASYTSQASRQSERTINLDSRRGAIVDRNGHDLALSVDAESIYAVPQEIEDAPGPRPCSRAPRPRHRRAQGPAGAAPEEPRLRLGEAQGRPAPRAAVRDLQLPGIGFLTENRRYYPKRELASQVLGYVGLDNTGMSGIEYAFEEQIRGKAAKVTVHIDARRRPSATPRSRRPTATPSCSRSTSHPARGGEGARALRAGDELHRRRRGRDGPAHRRGPRHGQPPDLQPEPLRRLRLRRWRNRAVADAYEPGSIFKIFTAAAGLQEKVVDPDEVLDCGHGSIEIAGTRSTTTTSSTS